MENITNSYELELKSEIQRLKEKLTGKQEIIDNLKHNINKVDFILDDLTQDYSFPEKPDPRAAIEYMRKRSLDSTNKHGEQSAKWYHEYNRIFNLLNISQDYITTIREEIKKNEKICS